MDHKLQFIFQPTKKYLISSLLSSILHFGFKIGFRYWRLNRYYANHPDELKQFIDICRQKAILEPHFPWAEFADQCEKSLENYLRRKKN